MATSDELKDRFRELRTSLEALPEVSEPPKSTFNVLGSTRSEQHWNTFLGYFLDPSQPHGFGVELLKSFLDKAREEAGLGIDYYHRDLETIEVDTEDSSPQGNRLDIVIRAPEAWFVCIECKVDASEGARQTERYIEDTHLGIEEKSEYPDGGHHYLFLSKEHGPDSTADGFVDLYWWQVVEAFYERLKQSHGRFPARSVNQLEDFLSTVTQVINMGENDFTETQKEKVRLLAEYREEIDELFASTNQLRQRAIEEWPDRFRSHVDEGLWTDEWHAIPSKWGQMFRDGWFLDGELNPTTDIEETKGNVGVRLFLMHYIRHEESFLEGNLRFELGCSTRVPVRDEFHRLYNSERWQEELKPILNERDIVNRGNMAEYTRKVYDFDQSELPESYFDMLATAFEEHLPVAEIADEILNEAVANVKEN